MKNTISFVLIVLLSTIGTSIQANDNKLELNLRDSHVYGTKSVGLRRLIRQQYPAVNLHNKELKRVVVYAVGYSPYSSLQLRIGNSWSPAKFLNQQRSVEHKSGKYRHGIQFEKIRFKNPANRYHNDENWRLNMHGNITVDRIVVNLSDRHNHYSDSDRGSRRNWISIGRHRTRAHDSVNRHIAIDDRISAIRITAAKRSTHIREAWLEYENGQIERIPELEGRLSSDSPMKVRLHSRHNVRKLHLKVRSAGRHRGYFDIEVRSTS